MLDSLTLRFTDSPPITLPAKGITVFVGANNAGKSLVLRELEQAISNNAKLENQLILDDFELRWPDPENISEIFSRFERFRQPNTPSDHFTIGQINPSGGVERGSVAGSTVKTVIKTKQKYWMASQVLRHTLLRLDGRSRFNLTNDQAGGDLTGEPQNILAHIFSNDSVRKKIRDSIYEAFGAYFVIDPTNLGSLRIRISSKKPGREEQSLDARARDFHRNALYIKECSDGVQAYTGIVTAVLSGEFDTILVDEPEAFLHPPLARKLGRHLAKVSAERGGCLLASTHSADFLMGCMQQGTDVRVVRLEHKSGKSRGKIVDPKELRALLKKPLMRSANVVTSLFHEGVVVTESDNDRAFYSEIYSRIAEIEDGLPSMLFLNAQNKQTARDIVGPLRKFGVPAAAIVDIDLVKDGGQDWAGWLKAVQVPTALHSSYGAQRGAIKDLLIQTGKDMARDGGVALLTGADRQAAEQFFSDIASFGLFAVERGELESWLPDLNIPGKKTAWTVACLEALGDDPGDANYVHPANDEVWAFVRGIALWVANPARKGVS